MVLHDDASLGESPAKVTDAGSGDTHAAKVQSHLEHEPVQEQVAAKDVRDAAQTNNEPYFAMYQSKKGPLFDQQMYHEAYNGFLERTHDPKNELVEWQGRGFQHEHHKRTANGQQPVQSTSSAGEAQQDPTGITTTDPSSFAVPDV